MASAHHLAPAARPGNRGFANRVRNFANRVRAQPAFPAMAIIGLAAAAIMAVAGAFGTGRMPPETRFAFWLLLIGWNVVKWQLWFAWHVRAPADWPRAAALGALVLNLPLPIEIAGGLALFGLPQPADAWVIWAQALTISAAIFATIFLVMRTRRRADSPAPAIAPALLPVDGLLARAGLRQPEQLAAIQAEDHFCRLLLSDGRSLLIHARFGDALAEVAALDGAQVHRGAWVAGHAVKGAARVNRRWQLQLAHGVRLPVSASHLADTRRRGWLNPSL